MYKRSSKSSLSFILFILIGIVVGGFIGEFLGGLSFLSWLRYGQTFGITDPFSLDLGILALHFGFTVKITIAGILGIILSLFVYKRL